MSDIAIEIRGLGKKYHIGRVASKRPSLNETVVRSLSAPYHRVRSLIGKQLPTYADKEFWALKDVSFDIERGGNYGLIGVNGSGKSTLLKIISHIVSPTEGYVKTRGRIGTLLEVGTGFHNELTGRENLYVNGAILGMSRSDINKMFDTILDFAGVEEFIDTPIKRYSTGMRMRLAFSIAIHLRPEIMIFDEVLAVGDPAFREKCIQKILEISRQATIILVSHSLGHILQLSETVVWLDKGRVVEIGPTNQVVRNYQRAILPYTAAGSGGVADLTIRGQAQIELLRVAVLNEHDLPTPRVESADPLRVRIEYVVNEPVEGVHALCIFEEAETKLEVLAVGDADTDPLRLETRQPGRYVGELELPPLLFGPGLYRLTVRIEKPFGRIFDEQKWVVSFRVFDSKSQRSQWYPKPRPGLLGLEIPWNYREWPELQPALDTPSGEQEPVTAESEG